MKKKLLVTMVGVLMLLQAPLVTSEEMVTISVKDLNALKSLCSSIDGVTASSASGGAAAAITTSTKAAGPAIGKVVKVASLRGFLDLDKEANAIERRKQIKVSGGITRNWELQPPSIPHGIDKDRITLKGNTCLKCHSKQNYEKEKAPQIAESHYINRDGKVLDKPSSRRWFCNQCHTPQADATPLVENTF